MFGGDGSEVGGKADEGMVGEAGKGAEGRAGGSGKGWQEGADDWRAGDALFIDADGREQEHEGRRVGPGKDVSGGFWG